MSPLLGVFSHGCNRGHFEVFDIAGLTYCPTIFNTVNIEIFFASNFAVISDQSAGLSRGQDIYPSDICSKGRTTNGDTYQIRLSVLKFSKTTV